MATMSLPQPAPNRVKNLGTDDNALQAPTFEQTEAAWLRLHLIPLLQEYLIKAQQRLAELNEAVQE